MATTLRNDAKSEIINILRNQGYPTYARLVDYVDIYLSDDPNVIGYMIPGQAKVVLNKNLNISQVSTIVRHEILHEYLTHGPRQEAFDKAHADLHPELASDIANIAADYEISNRGYTDADKSVARAIRLGDRVLKGLVTEDEYPDWQNLTFEEMYKKLLEKDKEDREAIQKLLKQLQDVSQKDLDDMMQDADNIEKSAGSPSDGSSQPSGKNDSSSSEKQSDTSDGKGETANDVSKAASRLKKAIQDTKDDLADTSADAEQSDTVFDTPKEQRDKADVAARAQKLQDALNDLKQQAAAIEEAEGAVRRERAAKAARDVERYQGTGLSQFKLNLNKFIADQIGEFEDDSYSRIHPSYEDSEFIVPGKLVREDKNVPLINVYHDNSGSFNDAKKTAAAFKAIESLNQYVRDGDIEIEVYYFGNVVGSERGKVGGGTYGTPILDHIEQTKPDNVIIITDGDITDCSRVVTVPGAVWMLFYDSRSENLMNHLKGKKQNKYYDIIY